MRPSTLFSLMLTTMLPAADLSLEQAIARALARNETAQDAGLQNDLAASRVAELTGALLPQWTATADAVRRTQAHQPYGGRQQGRASLQTQVSIGVFDPAAWQRLAAARLQGAAAEADSQEQRRQLSFTVCEAALALTAAVALAEASEARQETARTALVEREARIAQGASATQERLRPALDLATANAAAIVAKQQADEANAVVQGLLVWDVRAEQQLSLAMSPLSEPAGSPDELVRSGLRDRPDLRQLVHQEEAARTLRSAEQAGRLPRVQAQAGVQDSTPFGPRAEDPDERRPEWSVGLAATWELYDGGARRERMTQQDLEARRVRLQRSLRERQLRLDFDSLRQRRHAAEATVAETEARVLLAQAGVADAQQRQQLGVATALEMSEARSQYDLAVSDRIRARLAVQRSILDLRRILGRWPLADSSPHVDRVGDEQKARVDQ
jgi:outer membrane protein TolC